MSYIGIESYQKISASDLLFGWRTDVGDPSKYIGMEADVIFGYVKTALYEDFPLQSATIISTIISTSDQHRFSHTFNQVIALGNIWEQFVEVCIPPTACNCEPSNGHIIPQIQVQQIVLVRRVIVVIRAIILESRVIIRDVNLIGII